MNTCSSSYTCHSHFIVLLDLPEDGNTSDIRGDYDTDSSGDGKECCSADSSDLENDDSNNATCNVHEWATTFQSQSVDSGQWTTSDAVCPRGLYKE